MLGKMKICVLLLCWILPLGLHAQKKKREAAWASKPEPTDTLRPFVMPYQIAPLDTLIKRAQLHSPLLQSQDALIETKLVNREVTAFDWTDMARVFAGTSYGNGQILNNATDGGGTINTLATRQDVSYSVGFNFTLSPYDLITRKRRLQGLDTEILRAKTDRIVLEERIAESVIYRYQDLMLAIDMEKILLNSLQNQEINVELIEGYFQAGDVSYAEYNRAIESLTESRTDCAGALNTTKRAYLLLKSIVGDELY